MYIVRWKPTSPSNAQKFLGARLEEYPTDPWRTNVESFKDAHKFESLEEAKEARDAKNTLAPYLEIFELTYGLIWKTISEGQVLDEARYYKNRIECWQTTRKSAKRFVSAKAARLERDYQDLYKFQPLPHDGDPTCAYGTLVVRFLRKVA